ncbi:sulfatase [Flavobacteriaceae bacterium]|nr:sulfatase [Flavobacteriaceae bacterium]MDA9572250.1 sulfatase [Flavobacteriaceae bacterium]
MLSTLFLGLYLVLSCQSTPTNTKPTNFIIIFADDLGYGDLSSFGHPTIKTPHLDRMAAEGQKWTNFYAGASVCTPSRAALLTGRLPIRSGMSSNKHRVLFPDSQHGLPSKELTLAEQLKKANYTTACIGKWHLGHKKEYLPLQHGFDYYFGIPYSNDMDVPQTVLKEKEGYWNVMSDPKNNLIENFQVPLIENNTEIERPANQNNITQRYADQTVQFIKSNKGKPFFIYLAHNLPHVPLFASKEALGKSSRGLYGDVIQEIDKGVGEILQALKEEGLDQNTLVVFTSDNGPWTAFNEQGGSAGLLKAGKGTTWEGGMREPTLFWSPGKIAPSIVDRMGSTMDLFHTFSKMAGVPLPDDRILDSYDLSPLLFENQKGERDHLFYYRGTELYALRMGEFKAHYITQGAYGIYGGKEIHNPPLLYNLNHDPSEQFNIADKHPEILKEMKKRIAEHQEKMVMGEDQLKDRGND